MQTLVIGIFIFGLLIAGHEFGHFIVAKASGVRVIEFAIGMGPALFSFQRGETRYSLRLLPIGGYNRIAGMDNEEVDDPHGFDKKGIGARMGIIASGSVMNVILAVLLFVLVFMVIGIASDSTRIGSVNPSMPAAEAGLRPGDEITSVNGEPTATWDDLVQQIYPRAGQEVTLEIRRGEQNLALRVTPRLDEEQQVGLIGIGPSVEHLGFWGSIGAGLKQTVAIVSLLLASIIQMITGEVAADVAGPVGIIAMVGQVAQYGWGSILNFAAILSLNLGLLNLFPIPALDGSRLVFLAVEGLRGRPVKRETENLIHLIGFALLMAFMLLVTYQDLVRLLG